MVYFSYYCNLKIVRFFCRTLYFNFCTKKSLKITFWSTVTRHQVRCFIRLLESVILDVSNFIYLPADYYL